MKQYFYLVTILFAGVILYGCKKDAVEPPFDDVFYKPYTTGIIKFQYQTPTTISGISALKDTLVSFTSVGDNPSEKDDYGFSKPSTPWAQLIRRNPNNFLNSAMIFFAGTNLDALTLPYEFKAGDVQYAYINYVLDLAPIYDTAGNYMYNTYLGTTSSNDFELTVLSRQNNRLQGTFSGVIKNQDGLTINVEKGLFDIVIVDK